MQNDGKHSEKGTTFLIKFRKNLIETLGVWRKKHNFAPTNSMYVKRVRMSPIDKIKLVIFDFDGTLGDTRQTIVTTMQMTIEALALPERSDSDCASTIGLPLADCFRSLFPDLPTEVIDQCADTYRTIFSNNVTAFRPSAFPGVAETLASLKEEQGCIITIASSRSHDSLVELIHNLGLSDNVSLLIGADDVIHAKPHPEPVLKTLSAFSVEASNAIVVGDMTVDISMGVHAGTRTCGVTWGNGKRSDLEKAGADFIIDNMKDLIAIVKRSY